MKLADWLLREKLSFADFGSKIDRTAEAVRRYANGLRIPDRDTMPKIVAETGGQVTANDFFDLPAAFHAEANSPATRTASCGKTATVSARAAA